tara:strand:- start:786 stop:1373 length:588 start_codon:yes stop_codon:yes gene_type:complete
MINIFNILIAIIFFIISLYFNIKYNSKENYNKKENYNNFDPSMVIANKYLPSSLQEIFKYKNMNLNHYPHVEIKPDKPLFSNNKFLPECCLYNNQYSSDKGCPCITPDQQYYLQRRGINKHNDDLFSKNSDNNYKNIYFSPSMALKGEKFPFNPLTSKDYNIHFVANPPEKTESALDEFLSLTNNISYGYNLENL